MPLRSQSTLNRFPECYSHSSQISHPIHMNTELALRRETVNARLDVDRQTEDRFWSQTILLDVMVGSQCHLPRDRVHQSRALLMFQKPIPSV